MLLAKFRRFEMQDLFQLLRVGPGFGGVTKGIVDPTHRLPNNGGRRLVRQTVINPAFILAGKKQAGVIENGQVFGNGRRRELQQFDNLADTQFPPPQCQEDANPVRIGQRLGDFDELTHADTIIRQLAKCQGPGSGFHAGTQRRQGHLPISESTSYSP